jgi:hypothetical protein
MATVKVYVDIQPYDRCLRLTWVDGFEITCSKDHEAFLIKANAEGLKSLASICLTLAQEDVPEGSHVYLDEYNSLEDGSAELIIAKG